MKKITELTRQEADKMYEDLVRVESFLYGIEVTGKDDVYDIRQCLSKIKGLLVNQL